MGVLDYVINFPTYATRDLREMGAGLRTAGSELIKPAITTTSKIYQAPKGKKMEAVKKAFVETINDDRVKRMAQGAAIGAGIGTAFTPIGTVGGGIVGGLAGLVGPENLANSLLSTYNTSVSDIATGEFNLDKAKRLATGAVKGALEHPVYAAMDIAGIGGIGKGIGKAAKVGSKSAGVVEQLFPAEKLSRFNRELSNSKLASQTKTANLYTGYNRLSRMPFAKREEFVKQITRNNGKLSPEDKKIANEIRKNLNEAEQLRIELGELDPATTKNNTIAQYVMGEMRGKNNLLHKDIMDIIEAKPLQPRAEAILGADKKLGDKVLNLILKGEDLYDKKKIAFLSQELTPTTDPLGIFNATEYNLKNPAEYGFARLIGRATPEMQGAVLDDIVKLQLNDTVRANQGFDILRDALDSKLVDTINPQAKKKVLSNFRMSIAKDIRAGRAPDLKSALSNSGLKKNIDKSFYEALEGIMSTPSGNAWTRMLNAWKRFVLGNPGWIAGNRLGNWGNNIIEGVTAGDLIDIAKYKKYAPAQLRQQTSYNSMINTGNEALSQTKEGFGLLEPLTDIRRGVGRFSQSDKNLKDYIRLGSDTASGVSDLFTNPFFKAEAHLEFIDRYANYIRQAKRYASKNNIKLENVLKQAQKDKKLFGKLNTEVNKSLGDYYGRNYAAPAFLRDIIGEAIPFYRFPFQTARVTFHQMANHPAAFASNITIPARAGYDMYNEYLDKYNPNPEYYKGGSPYAIEDGSIKTFTLTPPPLGILAERLTDSDAFINSLTPFWTSTKDALAYKKFGRQPSSPTLEVAKLLLKDEPRLIKFVDNYKGTIEEKQQLINYLKKNINRKGYKDYLNYIDSNITDKFSDRFKYGFNQLLGNFAAPYILGTRYVPGALSLLKGDALQTKYDTEPLRDYPEGRVKKYPVELVGNWLGVSTNDTWQQKPLTRKQLKQAANKAKYTIQNIQKKNIQKQRGKK